MPNYTFSQYCLQALDEIENAHTKGYLCYADKFKEKYKQDLNAQARLLVEFGTTSHTTLFSQHNSKNGHPIMSFRLNLKVSASKALRSLLSFGETVIDCGTGALLVQIYACLLALERKYGPQKGQLRFDLLFGSEIHETPIAQRLLFSNNTALSGTKEGCIIDVAGEISQLSPFSFLFGFSKLAREALRNERVGKANDLSKCTVGSILAMQGYRFYEHKHPSGMASNYNCMFVGTDKKTKAPMFSVFGHGVVAETDLDLKQRHVLSYNAEPDADDKMRASKYDQNFPKTIEVKDVPGISILSNIDVKADVWEDFINAPLTTLLENFIKFINLQLKNRDDEIRKNNLPPLLESIPILKINTYSFPNNLNQEQTELLLFLGAKNKGRAKNGMTSLELESSFLDKSIREQVGLERKQVKQLSDKQTFILKDFFSEATVEKEVDKYLITFPKTSLKRIEPVIAKFAILDNKIKLLQDAVRAKLKVKVKPRS